jgi:hypothetical protein
MARPIPEADLKAIEATVANQPAAFTGKVCHGAPQRVTFAREQKA